MSRNRRGRQYKLNSKRQRHPQNHTVDNWDPAAPEIARCLMMMILHKKQSNLQEILLHHLKVPASIKNFSVQLLRVYAC